MEIKGPMHVNAKADLFHLIVGLDQLLQGVAASSTVETKENAWTECVCAMSGTLEKTVEVRAAKAGAMEKEIALKKQAAPTRIFVNATMELKPLLAWKLRYK
jgi:hypothetical protein